MKLTLKIWRQKNTQREGRIRPLSGGRRRSRDVDSGVPGCAERVADPEGRRACGLRARLPRRHLRLLRLRDQRHGARPGARDHRLPVDHAPLQGRRRADPRALARQGLPHGQGPGRRSPRLRPHHRRPAATSPFPPARRRRQRHPGWQRDRGPQHGRRRLHRLRSLRGGLPQRFGRAVYRGQDHPPRVSFRKASRSSNAARWPWWRR